MIIYIFLTILKGSLCISADKEDQIQQGLLMEHYHLLSLFMNSCCYSLPKEFLVFIYESQRSLALSKKEKIIIITREGI